MFSMRFCALWALLSSSLVYGGLVQNPDLDVPPGSYANRDEVKAIFEKSYESYRLVSLSKYAWGHDELLPLTKGFQDSRNGWGATIIDAMSTMYIMGFDTYFQEAVAHVSKVDFTKSTTGDTVSVFETTIRYIGGMLSAYELSSERYPVLLEKSRQLADKLTHAWDRDANQDSCIPWGHLDFRTNRPVADVSNIAEAGTLLIEWGILSKYTKDPKYREFAEKAMRCIASQPAPLPGLPAQGIDPSTGKSIGDHVTWGGGSDSYFEYLIKAPRLFSGVHEFVDTWHLAVDSSIKTLLEISTIGKHAYLGDYEAEAKRIKHVSSHLACFHGGNWIFGGRLLNNQTIVNIGLTLVDGCWNTYASTMTGIGPETFAYQSEDGNYTGDQDPTAEQLKFNEKHGFYITAGHYILRPEVLESIFYAWRATGDTKYIARAASFLDSIKKYISISGTTSGIQDVNNISSGRINVVESFWFAEVLKYLYLIFDKPSHISLDEYVFNTEAHPFKLSSSQDHYGSPRYTTPTSKKPFEVHQGITPEISQIAGLHSIKYIVQGNEGI